MSLDGTLRDNTERPETLAVGSNVLAGTDPVKIQECTSLMLQTFEKFDQKLFFKKETFTKETMTNRCAEVGESVR
jgi:UDP-N-acetylglucosamine 2-epimerase